jgi:tRNA modification GTPase
MVTPRTNLPDPEDTIVALSSAAGPGARAIVRLSGRRSTAIAAALVAGFVCEPSRRRQIQQGQVQLPGLASPLPVEVYWFAAPHTYTGQDVVELHTLSCPPLVELLIARCLDTGARAAQPGEFTMRAFLAGKLDLTRAEAVLGVIEAGSRDELRQALAQLAGGVAQPLQELREDLLSLLADVEAALDFAEEDLQFVRSDELLRRLSKGLAYLMLMRRQLEQRALGPRPFRVVLAGAPNGGKSSLFNALVGEGAALVSPEPGTTRDYLEQTITAEGVSLQLVDTAGLRGTSDELEASAQDLGREQAERADLLLWCLDGSVAETPAWLANYPAAKLLPVATKADLGAVPGDMLATSAVTGAGITELRRALAERARQQGQAPLAPSLSRCRHHVEACLGHLRQAHAVVLHEEPAEILALELRLALDELGAMVGAVYTDDLLDRIFSRFCIGK